jgi:hypothetical protein
MTSFQVAEWLRQGIAAAKAGDAQRAYDLLLKVAEVDEYNEQAWLWLSSVVESDQDREVCLENVLAINPDNKLAKVGLVHLREKAAGRPAPSESELQPPLQPETPPDHPDAEMNAEISRGDFGDTAERIEEATRTIGSWERAPAAVPELEPAGVGAEWEKPAPEKRWPPIRASLQRLAVPLLFVLGLLAGAGVVVTLLQSDLFNPAKRQYASVVRPLLAEYDAWRQGPRGALISELNSLCGPGADGWRNRDVLLACNSHPTVDCGLLVAHCDADIEMMRAQVDDLSRAAREAGAVLLESFAAISPPDEIALAHARFLACLEARVADTERAGGLARSVPVAFPDGLSACQIFPSAETEVLDYVGSQ